MQELGIQIKWEGSGEKEVGKNVATGETIVAIDAKYVVLFSFKLVDLL